jgi:hypothetical protein
MPVHDWTRVIAGTFHAFHGNWITHLSETLNEGLLPDSYYALPEQHAGLAITDVLTLREPNGPNAEGRVESAGGVATAVAERQVSRRLVAPIVPRPRTLTIRHASGHQIVALLEIVSPANSDRSSNVRAFVKKAEDALACGVHLLVIDLFPPRRHVRRGMPERIWRHLTQQPYLLPDGKPLTLAAFRAGPQLEAQLEHFAIGDPLREMPLFLSAERDVMIPLESTYQAAYRGMPAVWREVLNRPA